MATSSSKGSTPVRNNSSNNNNNYAAPHTPITSIKRPRSSLERPSKATTTTTTTTTTTPSSLASMSPMHPPRPVVREEDEEQVQQQQHTEETSTSWVGRQVDALFSPVLSFLGSKDNNNNDQSTQQEDVAAVTDEDIAMEEEKRSMEEASLMKGTNNNSTAAWPEDTTEELHHDMSDLEEVPSTSFDEEEFNPYLFIKSLPRYEMVAGAPRICLPPKANDAPDANLVFPVMFHGMEYQVHVRLRPYLFEFLERVHDQYEVVVFTASQKVYADELLNRIDPGT
jgi:NLI interacting factor-like phosphatase